MTSHNMRTASGFSNKLLTKPIDFKQGTLRFMSVEVAANQYLFLPFDYNDDKSEEYWVHIEESKAQTQSGTGPWTYNHLHDLESLWWVAVWIVFYNHFQDSDKYIPDLQEATQYLHGVQTLFPPCFHMSRLIQFTIGLTEEVPKNKVAVVAVLNSLRLSLIKEYREVQSTLPASVSLHASGDGIYEAFKTAFKDLQTSSFNHTLIFIPQIRADLIKKLKRRRGESTGGPSSKRRSVV